MVKLFIEHVLKPDQEQPGAYGNISSYYGAVKQQGRLTLHLHLIAWQLITYLEAAHSGKYITGSSLEVIEMRHKASLHLDFQNPTETLPLSTCVGCNNNESWWTLFKQTVNIILNMVNIHKYNKWGKCHGRFPRPLFAESNVEASTGHLNIKKKESWLNTFTYVLMYLLRCNTDVTSLHSGTAIKAVLIYVSDYITKPALKTHMFFDVIKSVFQRSKDQPLFGKSPQDKARKLMTQMSFVAEVKNDWKVNGDVLEEINVHIKKKDDAIICVSPVEDYIHCSLELEHLLLYEWICRYGDPINTACDMPSTFKNHVKHPKYKFLDKHPLYDTHYISVRPETLRYIPNFVGGLLPRCNIGDHEYYCTTMLTLFKPWHHGKDLKSVDSSWEVAFNKFKLLPWQAKIICNFNLRYECLDAKDDYNAQMRQNGISGESEKVGTKLGAAYMRQA
ncbi:hypothetical protein IW262DRAFT_1449894 [Armillaria fumosa]|nr:hypothetical protein IW262DRAFT_1449894 [Armillaria fumosa]